MSARIGPPTLAEHNRIISAERAHWPADALATCERLEREHPGWSVWWLAENQVKGWERPAGYCASRRDHWLVGGDKLRRSPEDGVRRNLKVFSDDPRTLAVRIDRMMERVAEEQEREQRLWQAVRKFG